MSDKMFSRIKAIFKPLLAIALVVILTLGHAGDALAARSGGRIGGGSFRSPSRSFSAPSRTYSSPSRGYYPAPYGGGFGFPFLIPFFGFGGGFGGLFTILIFIAIANFLVQTFRRLGDNSDGASSSNYTSSKIAVARVQVGLFAEARELQQELDQLALKADTGSASGRARVLQEATLALLRHPEYWVYGSAQSQQTALEAAEAKFNQLALAERSKFAAETLSNVNSELRRNTPQDGLVKSPGGALEQLQVDSKEYIVVTLLVGTEGELKLPVVNSSSELQQALRQIGGLASDRLLAIEILWAPQAEGDTLTGDDIIALYPDMKLV